MDTGVVPLLELKLIVCSLLRLAGLRQSQCLSMESHIMLTLGSLLVFGCGDGSREVSADSSAHATFDPLRIRFGSLASQRPE